MTLYTVTITALFTNKDARKPNKNETQIFNILWKREKQKIGLTS